MKASQPINMAAADEAAQRIMPHCAGIDALINAYLMHGYIPTIRTAEGPDYALIADAYDQRALQRGINARVYRRS